MCNKLINYCVLHTSLFQLLCFCTILEYVHSGNGKPLAAPSSEQILDTSFPIIIIENQDDSSNESKSYFGYSVSLAQGKSGSEKTSQDPDGWIFIGAPKSNATSSMYHDGKEIEPGVIWRCSLGRQHSIGDACEMVNIDPYPTKKKRPSTAPAVESFNGAWIGATMEINHGRLLACGMRWNRGKSKFYNGICYWFADTNATSSKASYRSNDLTKLVDQSLYDQRLTTFLKPPEKKEEDRLFNFIDSSNQSSQGHEWQISQAGMSVHLFVDTLTGSMPNLLIGAPGVREWSGAVALYTNTRSPKKEMERPNRNKNDTTFSEFLVGNRGIIPTPENRGKKNLWNEYFGYSVSAGNYLKKQNILYASGSPRADHTGKVTIFDFPPYENPSNTYKRQIHTVLEISAPKNSFASYFGSVLHTVDLDGDGLDELIVGAPLYSFSSIRRDKDIAENEREQSRGKDARSEKVKRENPTYVEELGDHGCVFIYKFNATRSETEKKHEVNSSVQPSQFLFGSKAPKSRFGTAISSLVFNMKNGTREAYLVIGAPYEPLEESPFSSGAIYIYLFNLKLGKFSSFIQRITASNIDSALNGFGASLSIPEDVDQNETPDIAIGSFKSGAAVVLRTRPKILLRSSITFMSYEGEEIQEVRRGVRQFYLLSCFSVAENLGLVATKLDIWVKVRFVDQTIHFHEDLVRERPGNTRNEIIYKRTVDAHTTKSCENLTILANHEDGIGMDGSDSLKEIVHPFHFLQEVQYNETFNQPLTPFKYYATTNTRSQKDSNNFNLFNPRNPSSQFSRIGADIWVSPMDCRDPVCRPDIRFDWAFVNEKNESISTFMLGFAKQVTLRLNISNRGETAAKPSLTLDWNLVQVKESSSGGRWLHRSCKDLSDSKTRAFGCSLGQYILKGRSILMEVNLTMDDIYVDRLENQKFIVNGAISFEDKHINRTTSSKELPLFVPDSTSVLLIGSRENDSTLRTPFAYTTKKEIKTTELADGEAETITSKEISLYSSFRQRFTIEIQGASVSKVTAHFKIPVFAVNSEPTSNPLILVKMSQISSHAGAETVHCESTSDQLFFHEIKPVEGSMGGSKAVEFNFDVGHDVGFGHSVNKYLTLNLDANPLRRKRDVDDNQNQTFQTSSVSEGDGNFRSSEIAIEVKYMKQPTKEEKIQDPEDAVKLACDSEANCMEVTCTIINMRAKSHVHIPFEMYAVKDEVDKLLKSLKKTALFIETSGYAQIFHGVGRREDSDVAQTVLKKIAGKEAELWVYIVAGIGGVILLALIILGLYKCGFFKREKRLQLNEMKAEHHRKSMIAAARASMMKQPGGSIMGIVEGTSQENLTDAEHPMHWSKEEMELEEDKEPKLLLPRKSVKIKDEN